MSKKIYHIPVGRKIFAILIVGAILLGWAIDMQSYTIGIPGGILIAYGFVWAFSRGLDSSTGTLHSYDF